MIRQNLENSRRIFVKAWTAHFDIFNPIKLQEIYTRDGILRRNIQITRTGKLIGGSVKYKNNEY